MAILSAAELGHLISTYGYWSVGAIICLESLGLPLPGETMLIAAAIVAGTTHQLNIWAVVASAAAGAILGDNIGYWLGRTFGYLLLWRYGRHIGVTERRMKVWQYLFRRYGAKVVFFGRFVAVLRTIAALLAGAHRMEWRRFLAANAAGGLAWVTLYGFVAYQLGHEVKRLARPAALAVGAIAVVAIVAGLVLIRRHAAELEDAAERAIPGPLRPPGKSAD